MATTERFKEPAVLTSWKEVASYLGKGVRTVQRWEKCDGLPIRRISGTSKIVVKRDDLDLWLNSQPTQVEGSLPVIDHDNFAQTIRMARQLREENADLRSSISLAMGELMDECRRMTTYCNSVLSGNLKKQ